MEVDLEAEYTISEKEYVQASKLYARLTKKQIVVSVILLIVLITIIYFAGDSYLRGGAIGALIGGIGGYILVRFLIGPLRVKRLYRNYAGIKEPSTIKLETEGVRFISKNGDVLLEWAHILKWRDNDEFVLLYQAPHLYHLVPKRLGPIADKLQISLAENVGSKS